MNSQQLQISLVLTQSTIRRTKRQRRVARAQWWFERMRRAVDAAAADCRPAIRKQIVQPILPDRNAA